MSKTISMSLSIQSIDATISELKKYKQWVADKTNEIARRLAEIGAMEASIRFNGAYYTDGEKDISLSVERTETGYALIANGESVCFIEFGAGVYFNGSEPYPSDPGRPDGVVGIGQYGKGHGKQDTWVYKNENDEIVFTHGTPAAMPMYHATKTMEKELLRIAREVFG